MKKGEENGTEETKEDLGNGELDSIECINEEIKMESSIAKETKRERGRPKKLVLLHSVTNKMNQVNEVEGEKVIFVISTVRTMKKNMFVTQIVKLKYIALVALEVGKIELKLVF
ncbi:hypothetical protein MKX03_025601 [Papaver bracteatum]|nr:hypothetical protein MKX03_025601 [Papaver bracteatum]